MAAFPLVWTTHENRLQSYDQLFHSTTLQPEVWQLTFQSQPVDAGSRLINAAGQAVDPGLVIWSDGQPLTFEFANKQANTDDTKRAKTATSTTATRRAADRVVLPSLIVTPEPVFGRRGILQADPYLCGTHSLNMIGGCTVFNPGNVFDTLSRTRIDFRKKRATDEVDPYTPTREELTLMALREGVVLVNVTLSFRDQYNMICGANSAFPRLEDKCFERAVAAAGGLVVLFPSMDGRGGHYVSVLPVIGGMWFGWDTLNPLPKSSESLGAMLKQVVDRRLGPTTSGTNQSNEIIGLLPIEYNSTDPVIRLLRQYVLANKTVTRTEDSIELQSPLITPFGMHYVCVEYHKMAPAVRDNAPFNLFTLLHAKFEFENTCNRAVDAIAQNLIGLTWVTQTNLPKVFLWTQPAVDKDGRAAQQNRAINIRNGLRILIKELVAYQGLLFVSRDFVTHRDWLRHMMLLLVARKAAELIVARPTDERVNKMIAFICAVSFTWHRQAGQTTDMLATTYPYMQNMFSAAKIHGVYMVFPHLVGETPFITRAKAHIETLRFAQNFFILPSLDRLVWLYQAAQNAGFELPLSEEVVLTLLASTEQYDDGAINSDENDTLTSLRGVMFGTPTWQLGRQLRTLADTIPLPTGSVGQSKAAQAERQRSIDRAENFRHHAVRVAMSSRFAQMLLDARNESLATYELAIVFGMPPIYAETDVATVQDVDELSVNLSLAGETNPHALEQLYILRGVHTLYGRDGIFDEPVESAALYGTVSRDLNPRLMPRADIDPAGANTPAAFSISDRYFSNAVVY